MKINDIASGLLLGSLAAGVYLHAGSFPQMPGQNVGPNMFPQSIAAGLMVCAIVLVVRGWRTIGTAGTTGGEKLIGIPKWVGANRTTAGFLMIPLALLFYAAVSESLGFIVTAFLFLMPLFLVFGVRARTALAVAALGSLAIHAMFYKLLKVPLPWGVLAPIAW
jgi:putative tricarboxylic transport membrane protein